MKTKFTEALDSGKMSKDEAFTIYCELTLLGYRYARTGVTRGDGIDTDKEALWREFQERSWVDEYNVRAARMSTCAAL